MLNRSASSTRRHQQRGTRSAATSPQSRQSRSAASSPGRRASVTNSPTDERATFINTLTIIDRRPFDVDDECVSLQTMNERVRLTDNLRKPRSSEEFFASTRNPYHHLVPLDAASSRSARNSLIPIDATSSRNNSLTPDANFNRLARNSVIPDIGRSSRNSLVPDPYHVNRTGSISLVPDHSRSARSSIASDVHRPSKNYLTLQEEFAGAVARSPRHSVVSEPSKSPRGSVVAHDVGYAAKRGSPRGSTASECCYERGVRASGTLTTASGSIMRNVDDASGRSRRSSSTLTFQEPNAERKHSGESGASGRTNAGPYRSPSRGAITTASTFTTMSEDESRRASSNSQVSDEQRRLCSEQRSNDGDQSLGFRLSLTTYGSVAYQLKDANLEASGTCDFICKALDIVNKTVVVTIVMVFLSTLPVLMLIMGIQFLRDCPREPYIPIYMVVGGSLGCVEMTWVLWNQLYTRRLDLSAMNASSIASRIAFVALTVFLIVWFAMGNYWILGIRWPDYHPTLFEPNRWCHRTLYLFSYVHLFIVHSIFAAIFLLILALAGCQIIGCPWLGATIYK